MTPVLRSTSAGEADLHPAEATRLESLKGFDILDTAPEEPFDRLTALAADLFDAPIALVSLVDAERQWFKSRIGLDVASTDRKLAFCAHAILGGPDSVMVVQDATLDPRFRDNPLVTGPPDIRFYACALLSTPEGNNLGTLCVIDRKARDQPSAAQLRTLASLAGLAVNELKLRRANRLAMARQQLLELAETMSGVGRWRLDLDTHRAIWSKATYAIYGLDRNDVVPTLDVVLGLCDGETRDRLRAELYSAIAGDGPFEFEYEFRRPDGERRRAWSKAVREMDGSGRPVALFGVIQDVTGAAK